MGGPSDAGIPASTPRNRPPLSEGEHYPTGNKSSETAEITGELGGNIFRFGMNELGADWVGAGVDGDRRGRTAGLAEFAGCVAVRRGKGGRGVGIRGSNLALSSARRRERSTLQKRWRPSRVLRWM
jgi:hypothetical protein